MLKLFCKIDCIVRVFKSLLKSRKLSVSQIVYTQTNIYNCLVRSGSSFLYKDFDIGYLDQTVCLGCSGYLQFICGDNTA